MRRTFIQLVLLLCAGGIFLSLTSCHNPYYDDPPLHEAARRGKVNKVKKLIKQGERVNSVNREGATPLHWAAFKGHIDVAKVLLQSGAKVNARTKKGSTPYKLAVTHHEDKMAAFLKKYGGRE